MGEDRYGKESVMSINVIFTGLYRNEIGITDMSLAERLEKIKNNGVDNICWYVWKGHAVNEISSHGVEIVEIDEPFSRHAGIDGRRRQIYNSKIALQDFSSDDIILKLRWDLDFDDTLIQNISSSGYFDSIDNGLINHKIWTGFYSIQELFSPTDLSFSGYKEDLDKLINFEYTIGGISSDYYISHDGMMLMPAFLEKNKKICDSIKLSEPDPHSLLYERCSHKIEAWAYSYYIFHKYFKTGPLGTCYFKKGDISRWPSSIVDYNRFQYNYDTMIGKEPKLGPHPRYRVYDDVFIRQLVQGKYNDSFAQAIFNSIEENKAHWEELGV
jgi:hypothetical protein